MPPAPLPPAPLPSAPLPSLPISFVTALVALAVAALILRGPAGNRASRACFALLFAVFALQATLVGLRFGYGLAAFAPFQRALPFAVGPLLYLGFRALGDPGAVRGRAARVHAGVALLAIGACWMAPALLDTGALPAAARHGVDVLIAASMLTYLGLLTALYRRGPDAFEAAELGGVARVRAWLLAAVGLLAGLLLVDGLIALDFALFGGRRAVALIAWSSALVIPALLAAAVLYPRRAAGPAARRAAGPPDADDAAADRALLARIEALLAETGLHRDPDLSLSRLARRLSLPARRVSEAVNRQLGLNVSQYVNRQRVREAAELLAASERPVAEIMQAVGFRTKSNFNREFRRLVGESPAAYRGRLAAGDGRNADRGERAWSG